MRAASRARAGSGSGSGRLTNRRGLMSINSVIPSASEGPHEYRIERRYSFGDEQSNVRSLAALEMTAIVSGHENFSRHA